MYLLLMQPHQKKLFLTELLRRKEVLMQKFQSSSDEQRGKMFEFLRIEIHNFLRSNECWTNFSFAKAKIWKIKILIICWIKCFNFNNFSFYVFLYLHWYIFTALVCMLIKSWLYKPDCTVQNLPCTHNIYLNLKLSTS